MRIAAEMAWVMNRYYKEHGILFDVTGVWKRGEKYPYVPSMKVAVNDLNTSDE